jgi:hypothetical protein
MIISNASAATYFDPSRNELSLPGVWLQNPDGEMIESYYRQSFIIPEGAIFKAIVNTSYVTELFVNGFKVPDTHRYMGACYSYWTVGVDITKYLKSGKNVLGIHAWKGGNPLYAYIDGKVVMASGKIININNSGWKVKAAPIPDGWAEPDFNNDTWKLAKTRQPADYNYGGRVRAYIGYLLIENQYQEKLIYYDKKDVLFSIISPSGIVKKDLKLQYAIHNVESGEEIRKGEISEFKIENEKSTALINENKIQRGVYVLSLQLKQGNKVIEERKNEPFIVVGKVPQKEVSSEEELQKAMGLKLVDTIKCTDQDDNHPSLEGIVKSSIVRSNGLSYRETGAKKGDSFLAYKVQFDTIDQPYLIVFEYPDDKERKTQFTVATIPEDPKRAVESKNIWAYTRESGSAITGGNFTLSKKMRNFPILYYPWKNDAMVIVNAMKDKYTAAVSRILIYKVEELPVLKINQSGERFLGMHTERGYSFRKMLSGVSENMYNPNSYSCTPLWDQRWSPESFAIWYKTAERLVQYLRYSGQNTLVIGCFQYDIFNTAYAFPTFVGGKSSRLEPDFREIIAALFSENNLHLFGGIELANLYPVQWAKIFPTPSDDQVRKGADTAWCVSKNGNQFMRSQHVPNGQIPNIFHPQVEAYIKRIINEVCQKLSPYPSFKGLYFVDLPGYVGANDNHGIWGFLPSRGNHGDDPLDWGYEDITIDIFEKDTNLKIPVEKSDPERFIKRYKWIMANAKDKWINWRCEKVRDMRLMVLDIMKSYRNDVKFISAYHDFVSEPSKYKDYGLDLDLYKNLSGLSIARYQSQKTAEAKKYFDTEHDRTICIKNQFDENVIINAQHDDNWPWEKILISGPHMPAGEHAGEQFIRALITDDPDTIVFGWGDDNFLPGHELAIRNFATGFLTLPAKKFEKVIGTQESSIVFKELHSKGKLYFYAANPTGDAKEIQVELINVKNGDEIIDLSNGKVRIIESLNSRDTLAIKIPSYGIKSFSASRDDIKISGSGKENR